MANRVPIEIDEWYHCFNRGVDRRKIFMGIQDYERFLLLMYLCNGTESVRIPDLWRLKFSEILKSKSISAARGEPLVDIGAYNLMPNHPHILVREIVEGGIAKYMQKLFTGYTMYFNKKYDRTGALLAGTFKSKHVHDDDYLKHLVAYIHLNPAELIESEWKQGRGSAAIVTENLRKYRFSSLPDFIGDQRAERCILGKHIFELYQGIPTIQQIVDDAAAYYQQNNHEV